jgi:histidinol dehydrogenase
MLKIKTRFIKYSDRGFKNKFDDLIYDEKKLNNKIKTTVSKILKNVSKNGDADLNYYVKKFDKINVKNVK